MATLLKKYEGLDPVNETIQGQSVAAFAAANTPMYAIAPDVDGVLSLFVEATVGVPTMDIVTNTATRVAKAVPCVDWNGCDVPMFVHLFGGLRPRPTTTK